MRYPNRSDSFFCIDPTKYQLLQVDFLQGHVSKPRFSGALYPSDLERTSIAPSAAVLSSCTVPSWRFDRAQIGNDVRSGRLRRMACRSYVTSSISGVEPDTIRSRPVPSPDELRTWLLTGKHRPSSLRGTLCPPQSSVLTACLLRTLFKNRDAAL